MIRTIASSATAARRAGPSPFSSSSGNRPATSLLLVLKNKPSTIIRCSSNYNYYYYFQEQPLSNNNNNARNHQYRYFGNHAASPTAAAAQQQRQNITKASAVPDMLAASIHNNNNDTYHTMDENDNNHNSALSYDKIPDDILALVQEYCQKDVTPVTMHTLVHTGRQEVVARNTYNNNGDESMPGSLNQHNASGRVLIQVANFLRNELPVRLAHRIQDLDKVPMMRDMPSVQLVKGIYIRSFVDLVNYKAILSNEDEEAFAIFLNNKFELHSNVLIQMARGAYELRKTLRMKHGSMSDWEGLGASNTEGGDDIMAKEASLEFSQLQELHSFLDRFYMSRIGIRILAGQYLALRQPPVPDYIGMICLKTSPYKIVRQAADDATRMCLKEYGAAPEVVINGRCDLTFPYIPTYLHYMLLEVIKNAMRATVEKHGDSDEPYPPVRVIIADEHDNEDVIIKIADVGGGIRRSHMKKIWSYLFTTADPKIQEDFIGDRDHDSNTSPLAGLGFGLPISRSYAQYFKGDLNIMSMEGFGTDCYIALPRLRDPNQEFS